MITARIDERAGAPTILVVGATGAQGGSVARHLLERGRFAVRTLTRNPHTEEARALRAAGADVVRGDLYDPASLIAAMAGCHGVFGVTSYWEHFELEYELGVNLIDAALATGIGHLVLSSLPPIGRLTAGRLAAAHFDQKAEIEEYARSLRLPATYVHVAPYFENFLGLFAPRRGAAGWELRLPHGDALLPGVSVADVGGVVATVFERRTEFLERTLGVVADERPVAAYAAAIEAATGRPVRYRAVDPREFAGYAFRGAADLADEFAFHAGRTSGRAADIARGRDLFPGLHRFDDWTRDSRERLLRVLDA